jgi:Trp operon repressor
MHNMVKRWVDGNLMQEIFCLFISREERKKIRKRKKMKKKFEI